jgi:5,10-methylenetetrahydromethanopterin reductase
MQPPDNATSEFPKLGVTVSPRLAAGNFSEYLRRVEELGFYEAWVVEDCFLAGGFAQAATALAATSSLRIGLGIAPAGARNVVFAAMEIGTLASMYPGRFTVGIGHGIPDWMRQAGAWPASPLTLLREYLDVLKRLLAGDEVSFDGRYIKVSRARLAHPPPVAPPVFAGVRGPRSLRVAGEAADGTILAEPVTPEYLEFARSEIGVTGHEVVAYSLASVADDPAIARERVRGALAVTGEPDWAPHVSMLDFWPGLVALRQRAGSAAEFAGALPDEWVDRLTLAGTPDSVRLRLAELGRAGANRVSLIPMDPSLDGLATLLR